MKIFVHLWLLFKLTFVAIILFTGGTLHAQSKFHNIHIVDPYNPEYIKGEVLIKFKDDIIIKPKVEAKKNQIIVKTGINSIDELIQDRNAIEIEKVFKESPESSQSIPKRYITDFRGNRRDVPKLYNIYKLKFEENQDAIELSSLLAQNPTVEYAEPNYLVYTMKVIETGKVIQGNSTEISKNDNIPKPIPNLTERPLKNITPNDPLYCQQLYLPIINAPAAWDSITGDTSQIIAIIDTGIDWDHPDLDDNIWINRNEIPDNGIDDDNNGKVDDIRGWDWINNDNDPNDDNSHGTHVAGISGAEGNNASGVSGVMWNVKLMPVKILQSSGVGSSSDLASGIEYASDNGATVINMSLGTYAESLTVKSALENAYAGSGSGDGSILIAAAGNDNRCICSDCGLCFSMYPACYSFVLGVMSSDGGFSNFDPSGSVNFTHSDEYNYEISAPGYSILSTLPYGNYGYYSGTSMSTPMVSGAVALMKSYNPGQSGEDIFVKLIQGSNNGQLDIYNSLDPVLTPKLIFLDWDFADTMPDCNNDGTIDAGETIAFSLTVKNSGGWADSVHCMMSLLTNSDTVYAIIQDCTSYLGDMSSYSTLISTNPIMIYFDSLTPHAYRIPVQYKIDANNAASVIHSDSIFIQNGEELSGLLDSTLTLTPDKLWLVNQSFRIESNGELHILPGTHLEISTELLCYGKIIASGNKDSSVYLKGPGSIRINEQNCSEFRYTEFTNSNLGMGRANVQNCVFDNCIPYGILTVENCLIKNVQNIGRIGWEGTIKQSNFINCSGLISRNDQACLSHAYNNFSQISNQSSYMGTKNFIGPNNFLTSPDQKICATERGVGIKQIDELYWGTIDSTIIANRIVDFWDNPSLMMAKFQPILTQPTDSAHGCVWKVEINDINPFEEYLAPLGSGSAKFCVYFNKPMDTLYSPILTFSAWEPYTHCQVVDSAAWSQDSTKWTAYYNITEETGDGINTIKVSGAKDTAGWWIPPEYNNRFRFVIQASSAASVNFIALGGLDKISLEWPVSTLNDAMGYNLYRYNMLNDTTSSDTIKVNYGLILDSCYTDYNIAADCTYYYLYTTVGTDLIENDYSKSVSASGFSTINGDANGDLTIDVLDITTIVSFLLDQNPDPFINYAADVNDDNEIDLLDIISCIQLINNSKSTCIVDKNSNYNNNAYYQLKNNILYISSNGDLAGIQFEIGNNPSDPDGRTENEFIKKYYEDLRIFSLREGFEFAYAQTKDDKLIGLMYNLNGQTLPEGYARVLGFKNPENRNFKIIDIFGSDDNGNYLPVIDYKWQPPGEPIVGDELSVQPNPFNAYTIIKWNLEKKSKVEMSIYDIKGRLKYKLLNRFQSAGSYEYLLASEKKGLKPGVYFCRMNIKSDFEEQIVRIVKMIKIR